MLVFCLGLFPLSLIVVQHDVLSFIHFWTHSSSCFLFCSCLCIIPMVGFEINAQYDGRTLKTEISCIKKLKVHKANKHPG